MYYWRGCITSYLVSPPIIELVVISSGKEIICGVRPITNVDCLDNCLKLYSTVIQRHRKYQPLRWSRTNSHEWVVFTLSVTKNQSFVISMTVFMSDRKGPNLNVTVTSVHPVHVMNASKQWSVLEHEKLKQSPNRHMWNGNHRRKILF